MGANRAKNQETAINFSVLNTSDERLMHCVWRNMRRQLGLSKQINVFELSVASYFNFLCQIIASLEGYKNQRHVCERYYELYIIIWENYEKTFWLQFRLRLETLLN